MGRRGIVVAGLAWLGLAVAGLLVGTGCGGGGGGFRAPDPLARLDGGWTGPVSMSSQSSGFIGPTGMMSMPVTGTLTVMHDASTGTTTIPSITIPGVATSATSPITPLDTARGIYTFTRQEAGFPSIRAFLIIAADAAHIAYADEHFIFAAMQKDTLPTVAPHDLMDLQTTTWTGSMTGFDAMLQLAGAADLQDARVGPDAAVGANRFRVVDTAGYMATTDALDLLLHDPIGAFRGDFMDSAMNTGAVHMLLTPDGTFLAVKHHWGVADALSASRLGGWKLNP